MRRRKPSNWRYPLRRRRFPPRRHGHERRVGRPPPVRHTHPTERRVSRRGDVDDHRRRRGLLPASCRQRRKNKDDSPANHTGNAYGRACGCLATLIGKVSRSLRKLSKRRVANLLVVGVSVPKERSIHQYEECDNAQEHREQTPHTVMLGPKPPNDRQRTRAPKVASEGRAVMWPRGGSATCSCRASARRPGRTSHTDQASAATSRRFSFLLSAAAGETELLGVLRCQEKS